MRYVMASREWFAAVHGIISQRASCLAAAGINDRVSVCEVYRDVPAALGWDSGQVAWSCAYEAGVVDFRLEERDDVRFKAAGTWAAFAKAAAFEVGSDPARLTEYSALTASLVADGSIEILIGKRMKEPGDLENLHDVISRITDHAPAF